MAVRLIEKEDAKPTDVVLELKNLKVKSKREGHNDNVVDDVSFKVRKGEIVSIAGIDGNGQSELIQAITGLMNLDGGQIYLNDEDVSKKSIRYKNTHGIGHIPEDRHRFGLVLDYTISENIVLQEYFTPEFQRFGFLRFDKMKQRAKEMIEKFDIRSGQGEKTVTRSMSGGNQQKVIIAREINRNPDLLIAVQPTRGLDVGAIEFIHNQLVKQRDAGSAVLLVSFELDEVMNLSDRILVMYEGRIVGELDPKTTTQNELGLYMAGSKEGRDDLSAHN